MQFIDEGRLDPKAEPDAIRTRGSTLIIDGRHGFGQVASRLAVTELTPCTHQYGVASAAVRNANHVGRLGEWVEALADGGPRRDGVLQRRADGGAVRRQGATARHQPVRVGRAAERAQRSLVMDCSTATMAEGKVAVALARGEPVPDGVLVDKDGEATNKTKAFYDGGALLPFGAHKGSGLSVMIQFAGGALGGTGIAGEAGPGENGLVVIALDRPRSPRTSSAGRRARRNAGRDGVLVPGEIEKRTRQQRSRDNEIPAETWSEFQGLKGGARA